MRQNYRRGVVRVSFFFPKGTRCGTPTSTHIRTGRCACNSRRSDNYPILLAIPPWKRAVIIVSRYSIDHRTACVANDKVYADIMALLKKPQERDCNNVRKPIVHRYMQTYAAAAIGCGFPRTHKGAH